ncbi:hypothetical protein TRAPUB_8377 [Trametes pubescens]|uniref:Uncharacterized protein n=1 Tax=Trametes pubescens TaxID=154538 RepID=A0A1M2W5N5_TRAPU|nr:hypothetical protein TRAPUB_8377 [Trametes pubescens]
MPQPNSLANITFNPDGINAIVPHLRQEPVSPFPFISCSPTSSMPSASSASTHHHSTAPSTSHTSSHHMDDVVRDTDRAANFELLQSHLLANTRSLLAEVAALRDDNEALGIGGPPPHGENANGIHRHKSLRTRLHAHDLANLIIRAHLALFTLIFIFVHLTHLLAHLTHLLAHLAHVITHLAHIIAHLAHLVARLSRPIGHDVGDGERRRVQARQAALC